MVIREIVNYLVPKAKILIPAVLNQPKSHTGTSSASKPKRVCPGEKGGGGINVNRGPVCKLVGDGGGDEEPRPGKGLKRRIKPGKCRMCFIPEEWFLFFRPMTGVTGPYIFMIGLANYVVSKEILVMEHEYYSGLSVALLLYLVTTRFGSSIGKSLDKEVDAIANGLKKERQDELDTYNKCITEANTAMWRAHGQKDLCDAKRDNIAIQLEAIYRERLMEVFQRVRGRLEYHVRKRKVENRIHQRWMVKWILENVEKSITPEFKKHAMQTALRDLETLASSVKR